MMNRFTCKTSLGYEIDPRTNVFAIYNALGQYEDAEEAGLFVRLPCKVGDTMYRLYLFDEALERGEDEFSYEPGVRTVTVEEIVLTRSVSYVEVLDGETGWHIRYGLSDAAKFLCRTKEEAEQALKEVQK